MKAKKHTAPANRKSTDHSNEPLPFELGAHLFALIRRNLLASGRTQAAPPVQLTFAL